MVVTGKTITVIRGLAEQKRGKKLATTTWCNNSVRHCFTPCCLLCSLHVLLIAVMRHNIGAPPLYAVSQQHDVVGSI